MNEFFDSKVVCLFSHSSAVFWFSERSVVTWFSDYSVVLRFSQRMDVFSLALASDQVSSYNKNSGNTMTSAQLGENIDYYDPL